MKKSCRLLLSLLLFSYSDFALSTASSTNRCDDVKQAIAPFTASGVFQGNVLLAKGNQVLCAFSEGVEGQNTRFPIASVSKPIVAALALKLQEQGVWDLHMTLDTAIPKLKAAWANQVSLHHLLANTSGLPNHFMLPGWRDGRFQQSLPQEELLREIASLELSFAPGTEYQYSNLGWLLLVAAMEQATKKSLAENLVEQVFSPLEMPNSGMVSTSEKTLVEGFRWGDKGGWQEQDRLNMQVFNAGAGIYSTTYDLLNYLNNLHQGVMLSSSSSAQMFATKSPYGWRIHNMQLADGVNKLTHSYNGQLQGHSSLVYYLPDEQLSLVILNNTGMGMGHKTALANDILRAYFTVPAVERQHSPSFLLHQSLLDNSWPNTIVELTRETLDNVPDALLVNDLAEQLDWSGQTDKSLDLYAWLNNSFLDNQRLHQKVVALCAQRANHSACSQHRRHRVGMQVLPLKDTNRQAWRSDKARPMTTHIFYPTISERSAPLLLGAPNNPVFNAGDVAFEAQPVNDKLPLVIMSHGTGGSAPQLLWLAEALVKEGYLVAAVNHHGNTAFESDKYPEGYLLWWERSQDLVEVRQQLLQDATWGSRIDSKNVAVIGFSLGGYTALSVSGGVTDKALFDAYCERATDDFSCQPQPEFSSVLEAFELVKDTPQVLTSNRRQQARYRLPNLKAVVTIAPAIVHAFKPESLRAVEIPTLLLVGSEDRIAQSSANAEYAHMLIPNSEFIMLEGAHHYAFLSQCTEHGEHVLELLCDQPHGVSREAVHKQTIDAVLAFLTPILLNSD